MLWSIKATPNKLYAVLAPLSESYSPPLGRLSTCYSPGRHSTQVAPFAFDLHVLGTPPALILSQDQTLSYCLISLLFYSCEYSVSCFSKKAKYCFVQLIPKNCCTALFGLTVQIIDVSSYLFLFSFQTSMVSAAAEFLNLLRLFRYIHSFLLNDFLFSGNSYTIFFINPCQTFFPTSFRLFFSLLLLL